jgi:hypothetical protein
MTAASSLWTAAVALVVGGLLCAHSLVGVAERQPFGPLRDVALPAARALDRVSHLLSLDRPARGAALLLDRQDDTGDRGFAFDRPQPAIGGEPSAAAPITPPTSAPAATTTTTAAPLRAITPQAPLRVFIGGDSAAQPLGEAIITAGRASGLLDVQLQFELGTGFARPERYNWPNRLAEVVVAEAPEAVVFFAGGNDYQDLSAPTTPYTRVAARGTPEWFAEYRRRVAGTMDLLAGNGRTVFWIGQPVMRDGDMDAALRQVNAIAAEEAAARPGITFIDDRALFTDANGDYTAFLTLPSGEVVECRKGDGIHLTRPCTDLLADEVLAAISSAWHITVTR